MMKLIFLSVGAASEGGGGAGWEREDGERKGRISWRGFLGGMGG